MNASDNSMVSINASTGNGTLTLKQITGLTFFEGNGIDDLMMIFSGTLENINSAIETITYTATKSGVENLMIKVVDQGVATDKTIVINSTTINKAGDVNADGVVDLKDVIRAGQISCGMLVTEISTSGDVNQDGKIGLPEMVFGMEVVAGKRVHP